MPSRVLLTIDTELTWRHHRHGGGWEENFARSYEAAGVGVPYQLGVLAEHDLKACFFVDPMPALLFGLEPVKRMVAPILEAGQEVQLHLHPFWADLAQGDHVGSNLELASYDAQRQRELVATARDLLIGAGAPPPTAFRSGSYAANADTLAAIRSVAIRYDSSHNGCHAPDPSNLPLPPALIAPRLARGIVELPVGQIEEAPGQLRHLQICAISFSELRAALLHARREAHPVTTIVSHSFELATRDGLRPNGLVQGRFLRLCRFLADHSDTLPTAWFENLADLPLHTEALPMPGRATRRVGRIAEQLWGGSRYEHPVETLTAGSGAGIGIEALIPYVH